MSTTIEAVRPGSSPPGRGGPEAPRATTGARRGAVSGLARVTVPLLVLLVLTQRIGLPLGSTPIPFSLLLVYAALVVLLADGQVRLDRVRLELFGAAAALCLVATLVSAATGANGSMTSIGLLVAVWLPFVVRAERRRMPELVAVATAFVRTMVLLALVGAGQVTAQFLGLWRYTDYLGDALPGLVLESYATDNELAYGSEIFRANAFVFLEPSFLSQFCALAAVVALVLRAPTWQILSLVAGLAASVSGTGIILLAVGLVIALLRARHLLSRGLLVAALLVVAVFAVTPLAPVLVDRADEVQVVGSSGYLRFVQPYTEVAAGLDAEPARYLVGSGPGTAARELESQQGGSQGQAVVYTVVPKLVYEYGVLAGGAFVLFIVLAMLDRMPWRVVPGAALVMVFFLSGSLLQPQVVFVAWLLTSFWTEQDTGRRGLLGSVSRAAAHRARRAQRRLRRPVTR